MIPTTHPLAVVPIFANAGAALLPAVAAGLASAVGLLFRPRALVRACRRRPVVPAALLGVALLCAGGAWLYGAETRAAAPPRDATSKEHGFSVKHDWVKLAEEYMLRERLARVAPANVPPAGPPPTTTGPATPTTLATTPTTVPLNSAGIGLGRDPSRQGYGGGPAPRGLEPMWAYQSDNTTVFSSPLAAHGRVYGGTAVAAAASLRGTVFCLDARSGKAVWEKDTLEKAGDPADQTSFRPVFSSPALTADGKYLLIGQGLHDDANCQLLCFDAETGDLRWAQPTPLHIESSPAVRGDVVVAGAGAIEGADHKATGDPGFVFAVRISDGALLWKQAVNDPESSPAIGEDGAVYIGSGFNGNAVVALRGDSDESLNAKGLSRVLWRTETPYPATGAITLAGDLVVTGAGNSDYVYADPHPAGLVIALDRTSGAVRWRQEMGDAVLGPIAFRDGTLYVPVRSGEVAALDAKTGEVRWRRNVSGKSPVLAGPAVAGEFVYAVSADGFLAVMDAHNGEVLEKHYLNDQSKPGGGTRSFSTPTVAEGMVFVGSETGGLRCFVGTK